MIEDGHQRKFTKYSVLFCGVEIEWMSAVREREHHSGRMEPTFQIQKIAQNMIRRYSDDKFDTNPIPNHQHRHGLRLGCAGRRPAAATARARDAGDPLPSPSAWPARSARLTAFPLPLPHCDWLAAEKDGYSGVGLMCRTEALSVQFGFPA